MDSERTNSSSPGWNLAIITDGEPPPPGWADLLCDDAEIIAADGGARYAIAAGVCPTHVIGDFDSLDEHEVAALADAGTRVHRHDRDKNFTDFELAVRLAADTRTDPEVLIVGGAGGRIDHELGNVAVLAGPTLGDRAVTAILGDAVVRVARPDAPVELPGPPGRSVSLVPVGGPARGVVTHGLRFALDGEDLAPTSSRGISNRTAADRARVALTDGVLLVIGTETVAGLAAFRRGEIP